MKRVWLVGALSLAALACDPNTKPTETIRNATALVDEDGNVDPDAPGWTIANVQVRVAVDSEGKLLEEGAAGEYGGNLLSGNLVPNVAKPGETPTTGSEADISLDCTSYDVKITDAAGTECEFSDASGLGPLYLCFSQARWDLLNAVLADCEF